MIADNGLFHIGILLLSLSGFGMLALASERPGELLLARLPSKRPSLHSRARLRIAGWLLLAVALTLSMWGLPGSIGVVAWLGWLTVVGVLLVFTLPRWTEKKAAKPLPPSFLQAPGSRIWQMLVAVIFTGSVIAVGLHYAHNPQALPLRQDAYRGTAGPWSFVLAERDFDIPDMVLGDIPTKGFLVRFCETCDLQIRNAYLKVNKPRSLRGAGMVFNGTKWDRNVDIQLPNNTRADSLLWLTVEGKDGSVHYASVRLSDIAPETARWFETRNGTGG